MSIDGSTIRTAVLLPGLDGTGLLMAEIVAALESSFRVIVVRYPTREPFDYDELIGLVREHLPADDYILVGESFSGPLVLRLALEAPAGLKGIVLGASFARLDLPLKAVLSRLAGFVSPHVVPTSVLAYFLLGRWAAPERRRRLRQALAGVAPEVLVARARTALAVDLLQEGRAVRLPTLYLRASEDRLIPKSTAREMARLAPDMQIRDIAAPHFLFQVEPDESAASIRDFVKTIKGG